MSLYLVDTDWVIDALNGQAAAIELVDHFVPFGLGVSLISYGELFQGAYDARNPAAALDGLRDFLVAKELVPLTVPMMERFGILRGQLDRQVRQQVGDMDLPIAATALTLDLTLITRNHRDFRLIPDLKLY